MLKKTTIPLILVFAIGLLGFVTEFVPHPWSGQIVKQVSSGFIIIGGFGLFIGVYSLFHLHISRIRRQAPGWAYSIFVFIGAIGMIVLGLANEGQGPLVELEKGVFNWFDWSYANIQVPCQAAIFSILAFFMASAAFRTFRARNLTAALLLVAAIIVMIGRVPVGETIGHWITLGYYDMCLVDATDFLMHYPNMAAQRAIIMGLSLGAISLSVRILFGIERSYLGGGD